MRSLRENDVLVIPCSGIGKVHGLIGREATYLVTGELAPGKTSTLCLALLVKGDAEAVQAVRSHSCITIDGCAKACARKNVAMAGGRVLKAFQAAEAFSNYRGAKPGSATALTEEGWVITQDIADSVACEAARLLRPDVTVTLCLPLFLAGNDGERNFARTHPTIAVDGCAKQCARWGTEQHSGPVSGALVVTDILGTSIEGCHCSSRELFQEDIAAVWAVAERIAAEVDRVLAASSSREVTSAEGSAPSCGCSAPVSGGTITIDGQERKIPGLPLIFEQCAAEGVPVNGGGGAALLDAVKIYHRVEGKEEAEFQKALRHSYRNFLRRIRSGK